LSTCIRIDASPFSPWFRGRTTRTIIEEPPQHINRRQTLKHLAGTLAAAPLYNLSPYLNFEHRTAGLDEGLLSHLDPLRAEAPCRPEIRMERAGGRFFLNGKEEFPFFAERF
jgi:hypothetical protein